MIDPIDLDKSIVGHTYYLPFWVLLDFINVSPPDPFIEVEILDVRYANAQGPKGFVRVIVCDVKCNNKEQLIAQNIPIDYLIRSREVQAWSNKIANWFLEFQI